MSLANDLPESNALSDPQQAALARLCGQTQLEFDIEFFDGVLRRQPHYLDVLRCQGQLLSRKGLHARALEIDRRLVELVPDDAVAHYNLGCSLALMGNVQEAVESLRQALRQGYTDIDYLEADRDLESVRRLPEYAQLLREFGIR
jgi:tetratricopeptide (TPR) repeat protein